MNKRIRKKRIRRNNKKLIERYPFLEPRNLWTDKIPQDYDYSYTRADEISAGWRKAFGKALFEELRQELIKFDFLDQFRFTQIKEKYGGLRLYCGAYPAGSQVFEILSKYEKMSAHVCEVCGKPGEILDVAGWFECRCKECLEKETEKIRMWQNSH